MSLFCSMNLVKSIYSSGTKKSSTSESTVGSPRLEPTNRNSVELNKTLSSIPSLEKFSRKSSLNEPSHSFEI